MQLKNFGSRAGRRSPQRARSRGFTLVELLLVLVILALIGSLVLPGIIGKAEGAKAKAAKSQLDRLSMASVRKPIRRLLRIAESVVGPATTTREFCWSSSSRPGWRSTSAYSPSVGRNMMAKSVVLGGFRYFS